MAIQKQSWAVLLLMLLSLCSCSNDENSLIEGRWQMTRKETSDGKAQTVDTLFYSFHNNVFQYQRLTSATETFMGFGNYRLSGGELQVDLEWDTFRPHECDTCLEWSSLSRQFRVRSNTSSILQLESEGEVLYFRKY